MSHLVSKCLVCLILLLFSFKLHAQDFEVTKIQSAYYPNQPINESGVEGEIGVFEWGVQVALPQTFKKNKKTILIHKIDYGNVRVNTEAKLPTAMVKSARYYHSISYNLGLIYTLDQKWRLVFNITPTLASDFNEKLSGDDFLYQANALAVNTKSQKLNYGFGLAYTTRVGRQLIIPVGLLKYNTPSIFLDFLFPNNLNLMFKTPNKIFSYGVKAGLNGGLFNNTAEIQTANAIIDKVGYSRLIVGPAVAFRLKDAININLVGGMAVGRRLELIDINKNVIDRTPKAAPFLGIGLSFAPGSKNSNLDLNN